MPTSFPQGLVEGPVDHEEMSLARSGIQLCLEYVPYLIGSLSCNAGVDPEQAWRLQGGGEI
jgi:hypothetical protein